ncbi:citrinin biosynthesis oxygenase CtnA [Arthroderma uncinatum]|uniref:citrinin biosynthesis oxygenase CtnA n=1 Tax=Arthroderma uncinatum TaxID=74035 RepID=UPI00144AC2F0|nr:citrinin biosynthesis oxygenase CtnA [Arthroderma uncinatum]KAF3483336.1 citrinin biosynthesis oxygenase CtnA [Arthroderma uncinatum]
MAKDNSPGAPTVDISPYLDDPKSDAARKVIDDVREACISTGFFQIIGHGIPKEEQNSVFDAAHAFFTLPLEEKKKLDAANFIGHRGYDVLASQSYEEGVLPDLKEGYYVGSNVLPSDPLHGRFFMGPNVWPPAALLPASQFQTPCERYHESVQQLAFKVLQLVGATMISAASSEHRAISTTGNMPTVLHDLIKLDQTPACPLRLLHYPSAARHGGDVAGMPQYGASAHTDFGVITLLLQDDNPGLEVLGEKDGKHVWWPIDPNPDAYVVNIGDMGSMVTNGLYKSSMHRVVCKRPERERYSVVFFLDGCLDACLRPVEGFGRSEEEDAGPYRTVEQHMVERLSMSYAKDGKDPRHNEDTVNA